jgi:hypothetical protein
MEFRQLPDNIAGYNDSPDAHHSDVLPSLRKAGRIDQRNEKNWVFSRISSLSGENSATPIVSRCPEQAGLCNVRCNGLENVEGHLVIYPTFSRSGITFRTFVLQLLRRRRDLNLEFYLLVRVCWIRRNLCRCTEHLH